MTPHDYCLGRLGMPWLSGARGPDAFDCWGLLVDVYRNALNIELPLYPNVDAMDRCMVARLATEGAKLWEQIPEPEDMCAVGLSPGKHVHHVGLWLDVDGGGVLHSASDRGVVFQSVFSLRGNGFTNLTFYRHDSRLSLH